MELVISNQSSVIGNAREDSAVAGAALIAKRQSPIANSERI
jgi:hypothetical protein